MRLQPEPKRKKVIMAVIVSYFQNRTVSGNDSATAPMERMSVVFSDENLDLALKYKRGIASYRQPDMEIVSMANEPRPVKVSHGEHRKPDWFRNNEMLFWKIKKSEK
jgi:hypothetical protein